MECMLDEVEAQAVVDHQLASSIAVRSELTVYRTVQFRISKTTLLEGDNVHALRLSHLSCAIPYGYEAIAQALCKQLAHAALSGSHLAR